MTAAESSRKLGLVPLPVVALSDGITLRGYLADSEDQPTADAALTLRGCGVERQLLTDASGAFAFRGLLAGDYELESLPHRGSLGFRKNVSLRGGDLDLDLALTTAHPLDVVVKGVGRPVHDLWVVAEEPDLRRSHGRTDPDGVARLAGLGSGPYEFEVRQVDGLEPVAVVGFDQELAELTVR